MVRIDGHDVRPNPESFLQVAGPGVGLGPVVVLVDTYELLEPLDDWLREEFVPGLSDGSLVVIAGRRALPPGWLSDPGWRELLRVIRLGNLLNGRGRRDTLPGRSRGCLRICMPRPQPRCTGIHSRWYWWQTSSPNVVGPHSRGPC